ncbi:threonine--tRNA ligase [Candidatus Parcubacteria bacterium]|nr:threonine--tRNA ligase [Candidatus Parcubacteria bacterium]
MKKENNLEIMRHSMSHVMAAAVQELYPDVKFAIGPAIDTGFYYDIDFGDVKVGEQDLLRIEKRMKKIIQRNVPFEKFDQSIDKAIKQEQKNKQPYKVELLEDLKAKGETKVSYYHLGKFKDLCRGPHLKSSNEIKANSFKLTSLAGAYWRGDEKRQMLTRIYGAGFASKKELDEYLEMMVEAEKRNHRKIGKEMGLFAIFSEVGQGLPIWLPNGYAMRRVLEDYMLKMERSYGYSHILTPIINKKELFEKSGHLGFYNKDMYSPLTIDDEVFYLKPMNCPAGMMVYKMKPKSYREMPVKMGEFGTVYRYEKSGELHGLQRVRGFTQNDAHIFCTPEQLEDQFMEVFEILEKFYSDVGFDNYKYRLSLGDDDNTKYVGDRKDWIKAEETMRRVLKKNKVDFYEVKGEAAFYGPKLDVQAINVFGKEDSISTIQVDFNLPDRFDLNYIDKDGKKKRPFVIHRALIGSFERFFAFLIEYYGGNFPLWFAPVQIKLLAVSEKHNEYCNKLAREFQAEDIRVEVDASDETVGKKIRLAVSEKVPYMLVIGDKEANSNKLHVRDRGSDKVREISQKDFITEILHKIKDKK